MAEKFEHGKRYVFDAKVFAKIEGEHEAKHEWVSECDGKEVKVQNKEVGRVDIYLVHIDWCREAV